MANDIDTICRRANLALKGRPGFLSCTVNSHPDRILAYAFEDDISSHLLQQEYAMLQMKAAISPADPKIVLVKHPE